MISPRVKVVSTVGMVNLLILFAAYSALGDTITVPGSSNPYLAGMPSGTTCCGGDAAPSQSPVQVTGLLLTPGEVLTFSVTGSTNYGGGTPTDPPDGDGFFGSGAPSSDGIAAANIPLDALIGVFLDNNLPTASAAPSGLDFSVSGALSFASLSPELKQVFFIGDGLTGNGSVQQFIVPTGATRLFLGSGDAFGWYNNTGSFTVTVSSAGPASVPEPTSALMLGLGMVALAGLRRFRRNGG